MELNTNESQTSPSAHSELKEQVAKGQVVVVVGAGVSIAATGGQEASSWIGFLRQGVVFARDRNRRLPANWAELVEAQIEMGTGGYPPALVTAAEMVTDALGGSEGSEFRTWLRDTFEKRLVVSDSSVPEAVRDLGVLITTTNYDDVLAKTTGLPSVSWNEPEAIRRAIRGDQEAVIHLHGHWSKPESVVLGSTSYQRLVSSEPAQAIQRALGTISSFVFIGAGAGTEDPNFIQLRGWLQTTFSDSEVRHYRLCLEHEVADLSKESEDLVLVPYGTSHNDLAPFLATLRPPLSTSPHPTPNNLSAVEKAREDLIDAVRSSAVIGEHLTGLDGCAVSEIIVPPVLLPVTHEQYANSQQLEVDERPKRLDPSIEASTGGCVLVCADESTGLTTALQWLALQASSAKEDVAPLVIDFRQLGNGHRPLEKAIRRQLAACGALADRQDPLPPCVVALDNVATRPAKILHRAMAELAELSPGGSFLGCREGTEGELTEAIGDPAPRIVYLGRLAKRDIRGLVALVEPTRSDDLAETIANLASTEQLKRTPLTIALLISVLLSGESIASLTSHTAVLDAYVSLLLGRGDPHDDARFRLDAIERSDILSTIAEQMVRLDVGSLSEADSLTLLERYFDEVGWSEDPMDVLANLIARRVVLKRGGKVMFAQNSFLYLFAAKRGMTDQGFRELLYTRPLYYAPIIQDYAALTRNDPELLREIGKLLTAESAAAILPGSPFSGTPPHGVRSLTEVVDGLAEPSDDDRSQSSAGPGGGEDWLESLADEDPGLPFPQEELSTLPPLVQAIVRLQLVSSVLRDSELVRDPELKRELLIKTLAEWGGFVELLAADEHYQRFMEVLTERILEQADATPARRKEIEDIIKRDSPFFAAAGGIASTLSSRKLVRTLDSCFDDPGFLQDPRPMVMGATLSLLLQEPGWADHVVKAADGHADTDVVRHGLMKISMLAHRYQALTASDERALARALAKQLVRETDVSGSSEVKRAEETVRSKLRRNRMLQGHKRLAPGETVLTELPPGNDAEDGSDQGDAS